MDVPANYEWEKSRKTIQLSKFLSLFFLGLCQFSNSVVEHNANFLSWPLWRLLLLWWPCCSWYKVTIIIIITYITLTLHWLNMEDTWYWWPVNNNYVDDHDYLSTGYLEDIWEGWCQLWDQEPLGCWLDTSRYACLHVCIYYNTSKYEDHEDHEDGEDDDYNDNYQNHATSLTWQLCQGFETACKNSSVISCTTFREPLRADHRLRSKMNLKSGPIWLEIWNLALFCLKSDCLTAQNFIMVTNPDLLRTLGWSMQDLNTIWTTFLCSLHSPWDHKQCNMVLSNKYKCK